MCEWGRDDPYKWGPAVAQSWRATGDHTPIWSSTKQIIDQRTKIPHEFGGAPYAWNDMDMLESGNYGQAAHANGKEGTMTATEYKTEFSMWAILASPLIVTTPILNCSTGTCSPSITPLQQEILLNTEVLAVNQDVTPAGRLLSEPTHAAMVYGRNLTDGSAAVALYNPTDTDIDGFVDFSMLGWPAGTSADVRDLWALKSLGTMTGRYPPTGNVTVERHGTVLLRLVPAKLELIV